MAATSPLTHPEQYHCGPSKIENQSTANSYVAMPEALTAENGAKALLIGEFEETVTMRCTECDGDIDPTCACECCNGAGEYSLRVPVQWSTIKAIYKMAVKHLAVN